MRLERVPPRWKKRRNSVYVSLAQSPYRSAMDSCISSRMRRCLVGGSCVHRREIRVIRIKYLFPRSSLSNCV